MDASLLNEPQNTLIDSINSALISTQESLECAICFLYLRDPVLTKCGHRFCSACIKKCLNVRANCPIDNNPLTDTDIFPDNYTKRIIANISVTCPNDGCSASLPVADIEEHYLNCKYALIKQKQGINECECPYKSVNCEYKTLQPSELLVHLKYNVLKHVQLLLKQSERINSSLQNCKNQCLHNEGCYENEDLTQCFKGKLPFYLNDVYEKLTELDQYSKENAIRLNNITTLLNKHLFEINCTKQMRETCNGLFVWEICNFDKIKNQIQSGQPYTSLSAPFSSSERGYRFQLRLSSSEKNRDALALHIHVVKGIYDPILKWPFLGKIVFLVINQNEPTIKLEAIIDGKNSEAFKRATADINLIGYGFKEITTLSDLEKRRFVYDNKLVIVVTVKSHRESDFVIDLKSKVDLVHPTNGSELKHFF